MAFGIDFINLIPQALQKKALDVTVEFVVNIGSDYLSHEIIEKIQKLRSDRGFRVAFENGLNRATNRFFDEYVEQDEDLVEGIANDEDFFENEQVQQALLTLLQNPGIHLDEEREVVMQSFDRVLPHRRNRKRVNEAVTVFLRCLAKEVWNLPELRPAYEAQFQRMTTNAVHQMVALQKAQLQASTALGADIRAALLQLTDAIGEQKLLAVGDNTARTAPPQVCHNLPQPDYQRFVGRKAELKQIRQLLSPNHRSWAITIDGIGGIGKSALALEVAHNYRLHFDKLPSEERFDAIIWTTAKQSVLTGEGIIARAHSLRILDDIYSTIAIALQREEITRARTEEQDDIVRHVLTQQRIMLIIDNLETVDDERVMTFIREVPAPTKVIVTTRHRLDVAYPIRLTGMSEDEALQLITDEANKKAVTLTHQEARRLFTRTGGVPLAIVWSVAQIGFGHNVEATLTRLGQPTSDIAKFCFEGALELIRGDPAHKLLMALWLFATDASRETLGYVANLPVLDRDEGLVTLEKLSLINKSDKQFSLLPLTRSYSQYELEHNKDFADQATELLLNKLTGLLKEKENWYWIQDQKMILEQGENFRSLLDWAMSRDDYRMVLRVIQPSVLFLDYIGRRGDALNLALSAKNFLQGNVDSRSVNAWLSVKCAWILSQQGAYEKALEQIEEAIRSYRQLNDETSSCFAQCFLAQIMRHGGDLSKATITLDRVITRSTELGYDEGVIIGKFEMGKLAKEQGNWNKAHYHFSESYNAILNMGPMLENMVSLTLIAVQGNYSTAKLKLGKYSEAQILTNQVITVLEEWRHLGLASNFTARMYLQAARIEKRLGDYTQAHSHAKQALALLRSTRNEKGIRSANKLLEEISQASLKSKPS